MARLSTCVVVALLVGGLLVGCGGSSKSTPGTATTTTSSSSGQASGGKTSGTSTSPGTATPPGGARPLTAAQRVEVCNRIAQAPSPLPASTKAKLARSCAKVGTGTAAERKFVHEVCEALASSRPAGAARQRALAVCHRAP